MKKFLNISMTVAMLSACTGDVVAELPVPNAMQLIFKSGFEHVETQDQDDQYCFLTESVTGSSTPYNCWALIKDNPYIGNPRLQYQGGNEFQRLAYITADPVDPVNTVLCFWIKNANVPMGNDRYKARIQANMYDVKPLLEFRQKVRMFLPLQEFGIIKNWDQEITWLTLFEFWNDAGWKGPVPFRISVNLRKAEGKGKMLTFGIHGQQKAESADQWRNVWDKTSSIEPPFGQWVTVDTYFKEGDKSQGRFTMTITPDGGSTVTVFDITNWTYSPKSNKPDGLRDVNPMKLYTNHKLVDHVREHGGELKVYWDDYEFYGVFK